MTLQAPGPVPGKRRSWLARHGVSREQLAHARWAQPFVHRADLWRFTRRSVPRGVAVGLLVGIFLLVPGVQIVGAALLCLPLRANIPIAAAMTFLSNPATTPFLLLASLAVGNALGFHADLSTFYALRDAGAGWRQWTMWLVSDAAPALVAGLAIISVASAAIGYVLSVQIWRVWQGRRWHGRSWKVRGAEKHG